MVFRVPRWVLDNASYPEGRRLPKWSKFTPPQEILPLGYNPSKRTKPKDGMSALASARHKLVLQDPILNFENWEYRFWCPENDGDMVVGATCRQCGYVNVGDPKERRDHNKSNGCYNRLVKAYDLMLQDHNCAVCDKHTKNNIYGVPICLTGTCRDEWMHDTATPKSLDHALKIVTRQEKEAKAKWEADKAKYALAKQQVN